MIEIVDVKAHEGYRIEVRFADGTHGVVDLSPLVGKGVFSMWKDPEVFAQVFVDRDAGTVAWPSGVDLAPEVLYQEVSGKALPTPAP